MANSYRAEARAVRDAQYGRQALAVARPRSVLGIVRSRGPLAIMLRVADAEGRLVRHGVDSFVVLERPFTTALPAAARGGLWLRVLRVVDRRWDLLVFAVPPALALLVAVAIGLLTAPSTALAVLPVGAVAYVAVFMVAQVIHQSDWLRRTFGRRPPALHELAAESYPAWNWSIRLCHHTAADSGEHLLRDATDRMITLVSREVRLVVEATGGEADRIRVREVLVILLRGVTTEPMREIVRAATEQPFGPRSQVAVRLPTGPVSDYRAPRQEGGSFFVLWVVGVAVALGVSAALVAGWERTACEALTCAGRPASWLTAAEWLGWRLLFQDAPGVAPASTRTSIIGWLFSLVGLMTVMVAATSARLAVERNRVIRTTFDELKAPLMNTRVLLMTVTARERDAVLRAAEPATGRTPERSFAGDAVVYELGTIRRTTVAMVQCSRQGGGGPGGAQATATEAIGQWKPDLVIMVGICCGLREDWTPPQELADVVVATSIDDLDHRIQYADRVEVQGDRPGVDSAVVQRMQAASTDFSAAAVHLGLVLSSRTLLDSQDHRQRLKDEHSRALAYEMEAQGLYAAAADARVRWTVVKAISDWGVDRDAHYAGDAAARNAAAFVLHTLTIGAFDPQPR
ncbi:hypothetical protein AB0J80_11830 [Actinoplanes sp. NPDC049548]|uniref:5'-methylthioadenosine/S-adenosylhomocysteine nucleosidase family protein n=1 Tax=Actinoplanes sp. NPDC049548 TaxID=3155152 RepID=UPI003444E547